jgi:cell division protein FtsN
VLILIPVDWNRADRPDLEDQNEQVKSGGDEGQKPGDEGEGQATKEADRETETTVDSEPTDPEPPVEPEHNFFIIAGSFKHLQNASDFQDKLRARGYPAEVMITENRLYRVSVSSYATKEEASRALAGVKSEPGLEACWLLSN